MPPAASPGSASSSAARPLTADERAARIRFRRAVTLMVMTLFAPGSAQLVAGSKRIGRVALRVYLGAVLAGLLALAVAWVWHGALFWFITTTWVLGLLRVVLIAAAVGWVLLFLDAWRLGRPLSLHQQQRLLVVGLNVLLCFAVGGTLLFGAHLAAVQRDFMATVFGEGSPSPANEGRYNILLMGGDSGKTRWGLRIDSITVASVDAQTGRTVLISLPRNLSNFPFDEGSVMAEQFPDGFDCEGCHLNSLVTWTKEHPTVFSGVERPGVQATIAAVEGVTGLEMNYWALVNMQGFKQLVNALGGLTLHVRDPIPIGATGEEITRYIQPGVRTLNGFQTLWFARSRASSDDYSRMARQKCVLHALLEQVSPRTAITNFQEIAEAGASTLATNLPASEVDRFIQLALEARDHPLQTVSLVPPRINPADPDMDKVHRMISEALEPPEKDGGGGPHRQGSGSGSAGEGHDDESLADRVGTNGGALGSYDEGYLANQAEKVGKVC